MTTKVLCTLALSFAATVFGTVSLQASEAWVANLEVPFAFHVQNQHKILPAGEYKVERTVGSPLTRLTNTRTGDSVTFINPVALTPGSIHPEFAPQSNGITLKEIN